MLMCHNKIDLVAMIERADGAMGKMTLMLVSWAASVGSNLDQIID